MESLRWILLVVGVVFVLVLYFLGRNRRRKKMSMEDDQYDDLPAFSARHSEDLDDGLGDVNIVNKRSNNEVDAFDDVYASATHDSTEAATQATNQAATQATTEEAKAPSDIIVLYILAKPGQELLGAHINSSVQAMGLRFGDMNIFHYSPDGRNIFSLANMLEPGSFDADTIHDLKTSGLTIFMQISGRDPLDDLTEMLQRSYQLAGLLDARLCNNKRAPLTEQDAENYRTQVREFING